jgi:HTH-type transcriptional regulator, competence development regulator
MQSIGEILRKLREEKQLPLRKVAAMLDIDTSLLSKIERNERQASREQVIELAKIYEVKESQLLVEYFSDIVVNKIAEEDSTQQILQVAGEKIKRIKNQNK